MRHVFGHLAICALALVKSEACLIECSEVLVVADARQGVGQRYFARGRTCCTNWEGLCSAWAVLLGGRAGWENYV